MTTSSTTVERLRANYSSSYKGVALENKDPQRADRFIAVREYFLRREVELGHIDAKHMDVIDDFEFPIDTFSATYTNPKTGGISRIAMREVEEAREVLEPYLEESEECQKRSCVSFIAHSKGNQLKSATLIPLQKKEDTVLEKLSLTFQDVFDKVLPQALSNLPSEVDPNDKNVIARRLLFVEHFHAKMTESINAKIETRKQALKSPAIDGVMKRDIQSEINHLTKLQEQLKNLDIYALSKALTAYPIEPQNMNEVASKLQDEVAKEILAGQTGWKDKLKEYNPLGKGKQLTEDQREYAIDVSRLLFTDLGEYVAFCQDPKHKLKIKNESIEDIFMREALKFSMHQAGVPGEEFKAEDFQKGILLNEMSDALKAEMKEEFCNLGIVATHAIGFGADVEYTTEALEDYPANATPEQKKAVDASNATKRTANAAALKGHIAAHRGRIDKTITMDAVRARSDQLDQGILSTPVPMPLQRLVSGALNWVLPLEASQFIQNTLPNQVTALTAMSAGVHFLQEITPPAVFAEFSKVAPAFLVQAVETSKQNPMSFFAVATALGMLATWVYPNVYGKDGKVTRKLNHKRIALAGAMTAGGVALALNASNAMAQWFTSAVNYLSVPSNLVNLVGWTVVVNQGLSNLRERKLVPLLGVAALGGMLAYGEPLRIIGSVATASAQAVSNAVQYVVDYNFITSAVGNVVAGIGRAIAPVVTTVALSNGVKLYSRLLPGPVGSVLDSGVTQFSTNVQKGQAGKMLGGVANTAYGISAELVNKLIRTVYPLFVLLRIYYEIFRKTMYTPTRPKV